MANKFPNMQVRFKDTHGAGGITVRGISLTTDEDGFIEGPPSLETEIEPHGFVREEKWFSSLESDQRIELAKKHAHLAALLNHTEAAKLRAAKPAK